MSQIHGGGSSTGVSSFQRLQIDKNQHNDQLLSEGIEYSQQDDIFKKVNRKDGFNVFWGFP